MIRDGLSIPAIRVHPEGRLLRHRPTRDEQCSLLPEKCRDFHFKVVDDSAEAVVVDLGVGRDRAE